MRFWYSGVSSDSSVGTWLNGRNEYQSAKELIW